MQKQFEFPVESEEITIYYDNRGNVTKSEVDACAKAIKSIDNNHRFFVKTVDNVLYNSYNNLLSKLNSIDPYRSKLVRVEEELFQLYLEFLQTGDSVRYNIVYRRMSD